MTPSQAEELLRKCGYKNKEQVQSEALIIQTDGLAKHVVKSMEESGFKQPKNKTTFGGYAGTPKEDLRPTIDPNDYEQIQKAYERY